MTTILYCKGVVLADRLIRTKGTVIERRKIHTPTQSTWYRTGRVTFITGSGNSQLIDAVAHCIEHEADPIQFVRTAMQTRILKCSFSRTHVLVGVEQGLYLFDLRPAELKEQVLDYDGLYVLGSGTPYVTAFLKEQRTEDLPLLFSKAIADPSTGSDVDVYDANHGTRAELHFKD